MLKTIRHSPDSTTLNSLFERCYGIESISKIDLAINPLIPITTKFLKPLKPYPDTEIDNNFTILNEDDKIIITNTMNGISRNLVKHDKYFVQNISNITEIPQQELFQLKKDLNTNVIRERQLFVCIKHNHF